jgi:hypothetical protein
VDDIDIAKLANPFPPYFPTAVMGFGCYYHRRESPWPGPRDVQARFTGGRGGQSRRSPRTGGSSRKISRMMDRGRRAYPPNRSGLQATACSYSFREVGKGGAVGSPYSFSRCPLAYGGGIHLLFCSHRFAPGGGPSFPVMPTRYPSFVVTSLAPLEWPHARA